MALIGGTQPIVTFLLTKGSKKTLLLYSAGALSEEDAYGFDVQKEFELWLEKKDK